MDHFPSIRGRGAASNPVSRFERIEIVPEDPAHSPKTRFYRDNSRTIIARNDSPDIGFDRSVNPYRGCEQGCIYCYARPTHEYLGLSAGLDFETRILVKEDAPELLRRELCAKGWKPQVVAMSGVTDPHQPIERKLEITRRCLEVFEELRNPVVAVTKNHLITRDADLLESLATDSAAAVNISITTLDCKLQRRLEPRASTPERRLDAVARLAEHSIPVRVLVAPVIPGLTDYEIPAILEEAYNAGARSAGYQFLRLPHGLTDLFSDWLARELPERKEKILSRIRDVREGKLNETRFFDRMSGKGGYAEQIEALFKGTSSRLGFIDEHPPLSTASFRKPGQLTLFDLGP